MCTRYWLLGRESEYSLSWYPIIFIHFRVSKVKWIGRWEKEDTWIRRWAVHLEEYENKRLLAKQYFKLTELVPCSLRRSTSMRPLVPGSPLFRGCACDYFLCCGILHATRGLLPLRLRQETEKRWTWVEKGWTRVEKRWEQAAGREGERRTCTRWGSSRITCWLQMSR